MASIEELHQKKRRRNRFTMTVLRWSSYALLFLSEGTVEGARVAPFTKVSHNDPRDLRRYSNDQESDIPVSININQFQLDLVGSFPDDPIVEDVHDTLEIFLYDYVGNVTSSQGMLLEDLFLNSNTILVRSRRRRLGTRSLARTTLGVQVSGGAARFTNEAYTTPTVAELESIIATGLENGFPTFVNDNVQGATISSSTFVSSTPAPTAAPTTPPAPANSIEAPETSTDDSKKRGIIAAGATGAFLGILIVAAALLVRRHRGPSLDEYLERGRGDSSKDNATLIQSSLNDGGQENVNKSSSGETTSSGHRELNTQDDSSQWTLSTYPEDANTVLTFGTGKSVVTTANNIDRTESFERDRQVSLRKDMLNTSPGWNATEAANEEPARRVDDTVLEPSHFVTKDEPPVPPANAPPTARFAANDEGEEIYLMPPATKKASKVSFQETKQAE